MPQQNGSLAVAGDIVSLTPTGHDNLCTITLYGSDPSSQPTGFSIVFEKTVDGTTWITLVGFNPAETQFYASFNLGGINQFWLLTVGPGVRQIRVRTLVVSNPGQVMLVQIDSGFVHGIDLTHVPGWISNSRGPPPVE